MKEDVVLTPIYSSDIYKYHECSNCKKEIYIEEDIFKPFYFKENIKFCPFCGGKVVRYAKPKYITEINWSWLEAYNEIIEKTYEFLQYKIHCNMTDKEIKELEQKSAVGEEYFKSDSWQFPYSNSITCKIVNQIAREKLHYTTKRKLENKYRTLQELLKESEE